MLNTKYQIPNTKCRGFTLIEATVSMFVFVLMMAAVTHVFSRAFSAYKYEKAVQSDLEAAQFALNTMAKELRTSSVSQLFWYSLSSIKFYDYSQGLCIQYTRSGTDLKVGKYSTFATANDCFAAGISSDHTVATGITGLSFIGSVSNGTAGSQAVGKVTILLQVDSGTASPTNIQTSVSLRDYQNVGL